VELETDIES